MKILPAHLLVLCALASGAHARDPNANHPDSKPLTPQEQLARFKVPEGFEVQLVAAEPDIQKPVNLNFDAAGRLWVTGSELYPWPAATDANGEGIPGFEEVYEGIAQAFGSAGAAPQVERTGKDTIRVLGKFAENGRAGDITVFADGLNIPTGVVPLPRVAGAKGDSVIAYSTPSIWRFDDTNGDGKADRRTPLYTGFGFLDTHGMSSNYILWFDGWVYGCHGFRNQSEIRDTQGRILPMNSGNTYRFKPDGSHIEQWSHGQTNPFGLAFDPSGNLYSADSHSKPLYLLQRGGFYEGIGKQHDGLGFGPRMTDDDHGSSAIAGIAYYADSKWPEDYRGTLFNGNPVTRRVNRATLRWDGSSPKSTRVEDFLTCDDLWFRPVQTKLGPDGALYIADFYNPIIGHYELPLNHPARDRTHGRIWRVVWKGGDTTPPVDLTALDDSGLAEKLGDANLEVRRLAANEMVSRLAAGEAPAEVMHGMTPEQQVSALWVSLRASKRAISEDDHGKLWDAGGTNLRIHLVRAMSEFGVEPDERDGWLERVETAAKGNAAVARAFAGYLAANPSAQGLSALVRAHEAPRDEADGQLAYARRIAMREILLSPEGYRWAGEVDASSPVRQMLAEVSLAVPKPEAARFLVTCLEQGDFDLPRAADFLRHIAMHLDPEAVTGLVGRMGNVAAPQQLALADGLASAGRSRGIKWEDSVNPWIERTLVEGLANGDEQAVVRAIAALRESRIEAKLEPLASIVRDPNRPEPLRAAALEALVNLPAAVPVMISVASDPQSPLRKRAVELLGQQSNGEVSASLAGFLQNAPWDLATAIAATLARSDEGLGALLSVIDTGAGSAALLRHQSVAGQLGDRAAVLRERVVELTKDLPAAEERLDGVIAQRVKDVESLKADAAHGAEIFQQQCAACHKLNNQGGNIGPNLDGVAAGGIHRLIEDILAPNRNVDPAFRPMLIETREGRKISGVNPREAGELLVLDDVAGKEVSVPKSEVVSQRQSHLSLMPPVFEQTLSPQDLADLVEFLLKR